MTLKHSLLKKWQRVTYTRYTIAFVVISIIQAITLIVLQTRILSRNIDILILAEEVCLLAYDTFTFLMMENVMFVIFNLYLLYFCLNAVNILFIHVYTFRYILYGAKLFR